MPDESWSSPQRHRLLIIFRTSDSPWRVVDEIYLPLSKARSFVASGGGWTLNSDIPDPWGTFKHLSDLFIIFLSDLRCRQYDPIPLLRSIFYLSDEIYGFAVTLSSTALSILSCPSLSVFSISWDLELCIAATSVLWLEDIHRFDQELV